MATPTPNAELSTIKQQSDYIWQDREIRFDSKPTLLACRRGEKIIGLLILSYPK
jgi:hypothetical protein